MEPPSRLIGHVRTGKLNAAQNGLVQAMTIAENLALRDIGRALHSRLSWLSRRGIGCEARRRIADYAIRTAGPGAAARDLSGGNQQKVVVAREMDRGPRVLVAFQATWGSRAYADVRPADDEAPVARLRAAGAVLVGKTNVPALTPGGSSGGAAAGADHADALATLAAFRREVVRVFERCGAVFLPSAAALPWRAEEAYPPAIDGREVGPRGHAVYTGWVNAAGLPAVALPLGLSSGGLPIGGQFVGRSGADRDFLAFGAAFEASRPAPPWPPFADARGAS